MKNWMLSCLLLCSLAEGSLAENQVLEGYLVDQKCASYYRESQPDKLADHSRACALACGREAGYGLLAADQFFPFDADGRKVAQQWLETSNKEKDLRVRVTGTLEGQKLKVLAIE
jgi:hypothetical protein